MKWEVMKYCVSWTHKNKLFFIIVKSYRSDCDQSVQGFAVFNFASSCLDVDQLSEVLQVEE